MMDSTYTIALDQALAWITANYAAKGIIVSGSIIRGNPNKNSDFDIYLIHDAPFRQRVQKLFNGVPCEIFVNTIEQTHKYFESELVTNRPVTANIIATGELYLGSNSKEIVKLVEDAKQYATAFKPLTAEQIRFREYAITNLFEDATDTYNTDRETTQYILNKVVADIVEFIFILQQCPLPRVKDRINIVVELTPEIGSLIAAYYQENCVENKYSLARQMVFNVTGETGFYEWSSIPE